MKINTKSLNKTKSYVIQKQNDYVISNDAQDNKMKGGTVEKGGWREYVKFCTAIAIVVFVEIKLSFSGHIPLKIISIYFFAFVKVLNLGM